MMNLNQMDFSELDRPEVLSAIFHPRVDRRTPAMNQQTQNHLIPVEEDVVIGASFHMETTTAPNILFFHGNGEIVADYDDMGSIYNRIIPFSDAQALYAACPSGSKTILKIPEANHNDIFMRGTSAYLSEIKRLLERL
ncbi:MAG: hypothetical protein P1P89_11670 [Desulfobacterales bacterium]|nr:hypothetical protein [Desulfobacterales bacterium]